MISGAARKQSSSRTSVAPALQQDVCVYNTVELEHILDTMARKAMMLMPSYRDMVVVGVLRRGVPLADMLGTRLARAYGISALPRANLGIKRYADDLTVLHPEARLLEEHAIATSDVAGKAVLLVDDVLYQGFSLSRAIDHLVHKGVTLIRTAVLVDRHMTRLPVRADITGIDLRVAPNDIVECHVPPYEAALRVHLIRREVA